MKNEIKTESIFFKSEPISVWILSGLLIITFIADILFLPIYILLFVSLVFCVIFVILFMVLSKSAKLQKDTIIERSESKSILSGIGDAVIVYDTDFNVIFFNSTAERLFKIKSNDILGHKLTPNDIQKENWQILIQTVFSSLAPRVINHSREGEYPQVVDISFQDPEIEFRVTTILVKDENQKNISFIKIIYDRTAQILALRSSTEFITIASHQLRGPLTEINWALQTLENATELNDTNKAIATGAAEAGKNLLRRIDEFLSVAKIDEGHLGYNFVDTDLLEYLGTILNEVLPQARSAGIKIYFDRPTEDIPRVMIDPKQLSMALVNILENAIRYNIQNGEVIVKVDKVKDSPFLAISIRDTGIGIPEESLGKLFTKFFRSDNAVRSQTEGSGLGLYIAKGIIESHGGKIKAESELNRGTIITFTLPTDPKFIPKSEIPQEYL
jgi:signal transduction histidine kinase